MRLKKIDKMHSLFGIADGKCKDCIHFHKIDTSGRMARHSVQKCDVYGVTHSEASDWVQKYQACGLFNVETDHRDVIYEIVLKEEEEAQCSGQIEF